MNPPATRLLVLGPALGDRDVCRMRVSVSMDQRTGIELALMPDVGASAILCGRLDRKPLQW